MEGEHDNKNLNLKKRKAEEEPTEEPITKKQNVHTTSEPSCASQTSPTDNTPKQNEAATVSPATATVTQKITTSFVKVGDRLEVKWQLDDEPMWWGCVVRSVSSQEPQESSFLLEYDPKDDFPPESRQSTFTSDHVLLDVEEKQPLLWRFEGDDTEPPELIFEDDIVLVLVELQEGESELGQVTEAHAHNNTFSVLLDSGRTVVCRRSELELCVESDGEGDDDDDDDDHEHEIVGADALVNMLASRITSDPRFQSLEPAKQQQAAEQVAKMREALFERLKELQESKGPGCVVTGEDMRLVLANLPLGLGSM